MRRPQKFDSSVLAELGLTRAEIKAYLALLELGTVKAGQILKQSGLQNSVVHLTLAKLVEKGLASFVRKGKIRHYTAADPSNILRSLEEKKRNLESVLPILLARQNRQERQEAEVFQGIAGLKAMLYHFIEDAKRGDEYLFFSFYTKSPEDYDEVFAFYEEFEEQRLSRGIVLKGIAHSSLKGRLTRRTRGTIIFVDYPTLQNTSIFRNRVIMTPWDEKQISFLITSQQLSENFRQYFYTIWNQHRH